MKCFLPFIILFGSYNSLAQYKIDSSVKKEFDSLFTSQPEEVQKNQFLKGFKNGLGILTNFKIDTLNIKDIKKTAVTNSEPLIMADPTNEEARPELSFEDTPKYYQWLAGNGNYWHDTLDINLYFPPLPTRSFSLDIYNQFCEGHFFESSGSADKYIYRYKLTDTNSNYILLKGIVKNLVLSTIPKEIGSRFYGKALFNTEPFYQKDDKFKNGFIHKKIVASFLFTCKIVEQRKF